MYCIKSFPSSCYLNFPLNIKFHLGQWGKSAKGEKMQTIGDKTKYQTMPTPCTFKASPFVSMGGRQRHRQHTQTKTMMMRVS